MTADCEIIHGIPCEDATLDVGVELDALPAGDLVELGEAIELVYRFSDGTEYVHEFGSAKVYVAGPSILYIVGDLDVTERGIVDTEGDEDAA